MFTNIDGNAFNLTKTNAISRDFEWNRTKQQVAVLILKFDALLIEDHIFLQRIFYCYHSGHSVSDNR